MRFAGIPPLLLNVALLAPSTAGCHLHENSDASDDLLSFAVANIRALSERSSVAPPLKKIALNDVRVFDGYTILPPRTVVIDGAVIGRDTKGAEHIDGRGAVLLPGLIDAHCHPANVTHLESMARYGVTTGFTMACYSPEMCALLANHTGLPDLRISSAPASAPGSTHGNITAIVAPALLVNSTAEIPAWIDGQLATHPEYIKLVAEFPGFDQDTLTALVKEAHHRGKHTVTHAAAFDAYNQAIIARSDHVHHAPLDSPITPPMIVTMLRHHQIATPTLAMMRAVAQAQPQTHNYAPALETVRKLHCEGIPVLAGTDANLQPGLIASVPFGSSMHDELENLAEAGFSNAEALRAATALPALHFGLGDRGVIKAGMRADLVLVDGNPLVDIRATRNIKKVWLGGVEFGGSL